MKKTFKNCVFDLDKKTLSIEKGSIGEYPYQDIVKSQVLYEDERFRGKGEPFVHNVLIGAFQTTNMLEGKVNAGLKIKMKDGSVHHLYISDEPVVVLGDKFRKDRVLAEEVNAFITKIINKYTKS